MPRLEGSCVVLRPPPLTEAHTMLRYPMHGFAMRVEDTVARAMLILQNREDYTAKKSSLVFAPKPQPRRMDRKLQ